MDQPLAREHSTGSNPVSMKMNCTAGITGRIVALAVVLVLLLLGHGVGAWPVPPPGQPAQISSQVRYDPKCSMAEIR